ncbi:MAG: hypothetical protein LIQ31_01650 [Planctomycetes bacterium]|nr:hypothetical protein [Planctomycetota bacterium]
MTKEAKPLSKTVQKAVRRHTTTRRLIRPLAGKLFHLFMFFLVVGGFLYGAVFLWQQALADNRFRMDSDTIALGGSVKECPESAEEIRRIGFAFNGRNLLDPLLVTDLKNAYNQSVWVRKVSRVRRRYPNRIDLELQLRLPVAQVRSGQRYYMIDMEGVLLPVAGQREPFAKLPEIVGVTAKTIGQGPKPGDVWSDPGVRGGLGILQAFWASPLSGVLPVSRVLVTTGVFQGADGVSREIRRRFEVVTESGAVVRWGTFNERDIPGELTSGEKMWHLQGLLSREEALRPGVCFDVRTRLPGFSLVE